MAGTGLADTPFPRTAQVLKRQVWRPILHITAHEMEALPCGEAHLSYSIFSWKNIMERDNLQRARAWAPLPPPADWTQGRHPIHTHPTRFSPENVECGHWDTGQLAKGNGAGRPFRLKAEITFCRGLDGPCVNKRKSQSENTKGEIEAQRSKMVEAAR